MPKARVGYIYARCEVCGKQIETYQRNKKVEVCKCGKKVSRPVWHARFTFISREDGKRKNVDRQAANKSAAKVKLGQLLREYDDEGETMLTSRRFDALCDHFEKSYLTEPVYVHDEKVSGLRSYLDQQRLLKTLRSYFGQMRVRDITPLHLEGFKSDRLRAPCRPKKGEKKGKQRAVASVNRELSLLRQVLNSAVESGWLNRNPFAQRRKLISTASERKRERILTREEEGRLLAACEHPQRGHLRPIIIVALDAGLRRGEILKLLWRDVDFDSGTITVVALNSKTLRPRDVAMTARVREVLEGLWLLSKKEADARVFAFDWVGKGFAGARRDAGLPDVRFHDLRHTCASRLIAAHVPLNEVGRILGHNRPDTTYRYVNTNAETVRRAAQALDALNASVDLVSESVN